MDARAENESDLNPYAPPGSPVSSRAPLPAVRFWARLATLLMVFSVVWRLSAPLSLQWTPPKKLDEWGALADQLNALLWIAQGIAWLRWLYTIGVAIFPLRRSTQAEKPARLVASYFLPVVSLWYPYKDLATLWHSTRQPKVLVRPWTMARVYWAVRFGPLVVRLLGSHYYWNAAAMALEHGVALVLIWQLTPRAEAFYEYFCSRSSNRVINDVKTVDAPPRTESRGVGPGGAPLAPLSRSLD